MSILFEPVALETVPIRNRFVHSATYEGLAAEGGEVTDALVNRYRRRWSTARSCAATVNPQRPDTTPRTVSPRDKADQTQDQGDL